MGFFLRPKDTNLDRANAHINAESIELSDTAQARFTTRHPSEAIEAKQDAPLPGGSWRGAVSRTVPSGFGRGTRAGRSK